jgi:hypothetical protein
MKYYNDYPTEPIGKGNPYHCCSYCKVSVPSINGNLENHLEWCEYRRLKTLEDDLELAKLEIECLKLEAQQPLHCVFRSWSDEFVGSGDDVSTLKLFRCAKDALKYEDQLKKEHNCDRDGSTDFVETTTKHIL